MTLKRFGDLKPGDVVLGKDGQPTTVVEAYDEHIPERMFEIEMEDGTTIKASGNHMWYIETKFDYSYHRQRRAEGKKALQKITSEMIDNLEGIATAEDEIETSLSDMVNLLEAENNRTIIQALERIAASLGHVSENNQILRDYLTGEEIEDPTTVRHYDAKQFCQQILSLTGKRKFKKKYPLIVGQVTTTEKLLELGEDVDIPVLESRG